MLIALLALSSCELLDPTQGIENPNITFDKIVGKPGSTQTWLNGQEREMAIVYNALVVNLELATDNYENTATFFNQQFDALTFSYQDANVNTLQFTLADLRQSAMIGLEEIAPKDAIVTDEQLAELYFYKGWSELLAGEIFVALPLTPGGIAASPVENIEAAIADFEEAETRNPTHVSYKLALARAYYALGDEANAVVKANEALALDADFFRSAKFDAENLPTNLMQDALYDRGNFDDLQPLPRLDFLDPKYYGRSATEESDIYFQKMEEAHFIIAEAQLSDNALTDAKITLKNARALVAARLVESVNDTGEGRPETDPGTRPDNSSVTVRASATDPFRSGLVLTRSSGTVSIPVISGTSVTDAMIDAAATTDAALEILYLMRQEVFIAEGRRFAELGLRLPVSETEKLSNSNITDEQTVGFAPAFIPVSMDEFTYDSDAGTATITHNMNSVLVQNKASSFVLPFH
jgi:hypothetical protein